MRKTLVLVVAAVIAVIAIVVRRGGRQVEERESLEAARAQAMAPVHESATPAVQSVRRLSVEDRRELRTQIKRALRQRSTANGKARAAGAGSAAADDLPVIPLEKVGKQAQDALQRAIPVLAACYRQGSAREQTALAQMVMISDPELGMVIDTSAISGADGAAIAPALDECLRDAIESLALPPLGVPGKLALQYSFRFD